MTTHYNWRNSGNGQYSTEEEARKRPKEFERERVKPQPKKK